MRASLPRRVPALLLVLTGGVLAGCADAASPSDPSVAATVPPEETCLSFETADLTVAAEADLDGDGTSEEIGFLAEDPCYVVVGRDGTTPLDTTDLGLGDFVGISVVDLRGTERDLLLFEGSVDDVVQTYLAGEADGVVSLVTFRGESLLPPLVEDTAVFDADCVRDGAIEVTSATVADPAALSVAWDVVVTTYAVDGTVATPVARKELPGVPDAQLREEEPALFDPVLLADCQDG